MIRSLNRIPWLVIALIGYYLPWLYHNAAGLTFNAYDLAEWISIHPAVRDGNPPLLAPFLLRAVLGALALLAALRAARSFGWERWLYTVFALALAITLMPPLEFFRDAADDPNYRQQFILAVVVLVLFLGIAAASYRPWLKWVEVTVPTLTAVATIWGVVLALNVAQSLHLEHTLGGGVIVLLVCLAMMVMSRLTGQPEQVVGEQMK